MQVVKHTMVQCQEERDRMYMPTETASKQPMYRTRWRTQNGDGMRTFATCRARPLNTSQSLKCFNYAATVVEEYREDIVFPPTVTSSSGFAALSSHDLGMIGTIDSPQ